MKKISICLMIGGFLSLSGMSNFIVAQITLTKDDAPSELGVYFVMGTADNVAVNLGEAGANKYWDFSNIQLTGEDYWRVVDFEASPFAHRFPTGNLAYQVTENVQDTTFITYNYARLTDSELTQLGLGKYKIVGSDTTIEQMIVAKRSKPQLKLPVNYGDQEWASVVEFDTVYKGLVATVIDSNHNQIDGWGMIKTQFGEFPCLRIRQDHTTFAFPVILPNLKYPLEINIIYYWVTHDYGIIATVTGMSDVTNPNPDPNFSIAKSVNIMTMFDSITLISPNGLEFLKGGSIHNVTWATSSPFADHFKILYSVDGGINYPNLIVDNILNDSSYSWNVPNINSDQVKIKIQAKDNANSLICEDFSVNNFTIDSNPPNTFNLLSPANGAWSKAIPTFSWQASSDVLSDLLKYQLSIDGVVNQDSIPATLTSFTLISPLSNGSHNWNVNAIDKAGNERISNQTWTVRVDANSPTAFDLLTPQDSIWTNNAQPSFTWQASSDAGSGLKKYQLYINEQLIVDNISPNATSTIPASDLTDGAFLWFVLAHDSVSNSTKSNSTWLLRIDTTPPVSKITNLTSGMNVSADTVVIEGTANDGIGTDAGCGLDNIFISFDEGNLWFPTINTGTNFNTWKYYWTGYINQNYTIKSKAIDKLGNEEIPGEGIIVTKVTNEPPDLIPKEFSVSQNYPNPFNPETTINFEIPKPCHVIIKIYNTVGQEVKTLINEKRKPGNFHVVWDARDNFGKKVNTGIYLYQLKADEFVAVKKMVMVK